MFAKGKLLFNKIIGFAQQGYKGFFEKRLSSHKQCEN